MAAANLDPMPSEQAFFNNTYYQILFVEPGEKEKNEIITTNILAKTRGDVPGQSQTETNHPKNFSEFVLDEQTVKKLKDYPRQKGELEDRLSSYLPSPGVTFTKGFIDSLFKKNEQTELGNFYIPIRTLLHSRKLSQLIAKTWWSYLKAKNTDGLWDKFTAGEWDVIDFDILDGLIAREIFLFGGGDPPDIIGNPEIYRHLKPEEIPVKEGARFLILPSSKCWQGISLSLLLAGQAYYKNKITGKYHQISQPIFSTGEIVFKYSFEVDWDKFNGDIKEIIISQEKPWVAYHAVLPYPPIPADADQGNIEKWASAEDDAGNFPFYKKDNGKYLIDVDYFRSPYPYIPLSCS